MKTRKNIYFTAKQVERLAQKSEEENLPEAEIVRRALDCYLAWDDPAYRAEPHHPTPKRKSYSSPA